MLRLIVFLIFALPIVEVAGLIFAIREFGFADAFFFWLAATILGVGILRTSGLRLTLGVAQAVREGKPPAAAALDTALVGLAGLLLVVPGYFSDVFALVVLIGPLRKWFVRRIAGNLATKTGFSSARASMPNESAASAASSAASSMVIDVEATVIDSDKSRDSF